VPDARIAGAYTGVTSLSLGANVVANVTTLFVGNSAVNASHTATQFAVANSTNTATLTPVSLTIGSTVANTTTVSATNLAGNGSSVTSVNAVALGGKTEANLNVNSASQATNATNLNSQPGSYYTNASNLNTGTVADARISGAYTGVTSLAFGANVVANVTTLFVGNSTANVSHTATSLVAANSTNTATLTPVSLTIGTTVANTTTVSATNLAGNGSSVTSVNAVALGGKTEANLNVNSATQATNATNLNSQPGSYYTNASNITTGTLPIAQLSGNVILTTSTTGINASALSTGTVPLARLTSANSSANGVVDTTTQTFAGNKTFQNTVAFSANVNMDSGTLFVDGTNNRVGINNTAPTTALEVTGTVTATALSVGANVIANVTTLFVGNSTVNASHTATQFAVANSTNSATLTAISLTIGSTVVNTTVVTATTKEFNIAHPTKPNSRLRYGSLESPYHGVRLTGRAVITDTTVEVPLPDYIHALCAEEDSQVQITNHGHDKILWVERIDIARNCFVVKMRRRWWDTTPYAFYWSFTAVRRDVVPLDVEGAP
jgi:hypothetical protein